MSVSDGINDKFEKSVINLNFIENPEAIDMNEVPKKAPDKKPEHTDSSHEVQDKESETKSPELMIVEIFDPSSVFFFYFFS